jgi:hypothetical protein
MAFHFEFDPIHRIIRIRFSDRVTDDDLTYFYRMSALLVGSLDPLSAVIDFSAVDSFESSAEFMRRQAELPPVMPRRERPRIVVAPRDDVFALARVFAAEGEATRPNFTSFAPHSKLGQYSGSRTRVPNDIASLG